MTQKEETEHAILNFFRVHGGFATPKEMFNDLRRNGVKVDEFDFSEVVKNELLEQKEENRTQVFKLHPNDLARFERLDEKWEAERQSKSGKKDWSNEIIIGVIALVLGSIILKLIGVL